MVKKTVSFFGYFLFFLFVLTYFAPKENLYYLFEQKIKSYGITIGGEKIKESSFSMQIDDAKVYVESIKSADISNAKFLILLAYNTLEIKNIDLDGILVMFLPMKVEKINLTHTLLEPFTLHISAVGEFGKIDAQFNLLHQHMHAVMVPNYIMFQKYQITLNMFQEAQNGEYIYEKDI